MEQDKIIRAEFKKHRISKNISQEEIEKRINAGEKYVSHYENGKNNQSFRRQSELLDAVDLEICVQEKIDVNDNTNFIKITSMEKESTPVSKIRQTDISEISIVSFNLAKGNIKENLVKMIRCNMIAVKLLECLLDSGIIYKQKEIKDKYIKVKAEGDDYNPELIANLVRLKIENNKYDEKLNYETGFVIYSVFEEIYLSLDSNEFYFGICESITDLGLENDIKNLIDKKQSENIKIKNYLKNHPKGVPFICGMDNEFKYEALEILQCELDISIDAEMNSLQIIEAWSEEEAKRIFIEKIKPYYIKRFYDELFVNEFAGSLYYGDVFDHLAEGNTAYICAESLYNKYCHENINEEKCIAQIINEISKEEIIERIGTDYFNFELETYLDLESFAKMRVDFEE